MSKSNPKYPGLTGTIMARLWERMRLARKNIITLQQDIRAHRMSFQEFRNRWGSRQPRSADDWLAFWREFVRLEDSISILEDQAHKIGIDVDGTSLKGVEICRQNGITVSDFGPGETAAELLKELDDMFDAAASDESMDLP